MRNVLVVGGAGFIGSHLCDALLGKGDKVICADNFSLGIRKNICSMEENENFILYETDASDMKALERIFENEALIMYFIWLLIQIFRPVLPIRKWNTGTHILQLFVFYPV